VKKKPIIGIVGGIGAGKSTVAEEFGKLGCAVISADTLNHEILCEPEVKAQIVEWWGQTVLDSQGRVDRGTLGGIVFEEEESLQKLCRLVHPLILKRQEELTEKYLSDPAVPAVVLDVPLLIEVDQYKLCDCLVFVEADDAVRHRRLREKRGWGEEKIKKIENFQFMLDKKAKISEYTVINNSDIPDLAKQVAVLLSVVLGNQDKERD